MIASVEALNLNSKNFIIKLFNYISIKFYNPFKPLKFWTSLRTKLTVIVDRKTAAYAEIVWINFFLKTPIKLKNLIGSNIDKNIDFRHAALY